VRWNARTRIALASGFLGLIFTGFSARLIDISVARHDEYSEIAAQKNSIRQPIYARRGLIYDRNGEILADNAPIRTVIADGSRIEHPDRVAKIAAPILGMKEDELTTKLTTNRRYVVIQRELPAETAFELGKALDAAKLHGIYFENDFKRVHPNGQMLCHVMGFLDHERHGIQGVEASMEDYLAGQDGFRFTEHDRAGREMVVYRGQEREPRDGLNVTLTIDMGLQSIVEDELSAAVKQLKPKNAIAILVNPKTGEVLAMASWPNFEPDKIAEAQPEQMKNHAVIDMFEPGSTFKIVASSGALNEGVINTETRVDCENGAWAYGGRVLRDTHHYGLLTVHDILEKSSNIGAAKLAMRLGDNTFYEYAKRFGFGERTGIELPGEIPGVAHPPSQWDKVTITRMAMGQSVAVTPLQTVMAMGVIANGGKLMAPHIIKSLSDSDGKVIKEFQPTVIRQVINPETASIVSSALADVVSAQGTAPQAAVPGFRMCGKTGTAQIPKPGGGYYEGKYLASFCGYMPAEEPAFVGIVMIDDANLPPHLNYGGLVSAPIYARIAARAARYLDLQPTLRAEPITEVVSRDNGDEDEEAHR
jgi:cell division protein FtsI (penicillin-binding protein 3)/stage V sporulation protein D (sporulation-specific penicillin-binding protein)